jgi:hypothetical protein
MGINVRNERWWVMHLLESVYPAEMSERSLCLGLEGNPDLHLSAGEVSAHLAYLAEKGFVARRAPKVPATGEEVPMARLTAHGKDLLDGVIDPDPGIDTSGPLR